MALRLTLLVLGFLSFFCKGYSQVGVEIVNRYDFVMEADFDMQGDQKLSYAEGDFEFTYLIPLSDCHGLTLGGGYQTTHLDWAENPAFSDTDFSFVTGSIGAYTKTIPGWIWKTKGTIALDPEDLSGKYGLFYGALWGTYKYAVNALGDINIHLGAWARTGLKNNLVFPIIGTDFLLRPWLKVNLIFPMNISLAYLINDKWSLVLFSRTFLRRHRVGEDETIPRAIFEYRNSGTELALRYESASWIAVDLHGGHTGGKDLKVMNNLGTAPVHYGFEGAFYAGGTLTIRF